LYTQEVIQDILSRTAKRKISSRKAFEQLKNLSYESLKFARLDHHRSLRKNLPEIIYAPGKTDAQLEKIVSAFSRNGHPLIISRLPEALFKKLKRKFPKLSYSQPGRIAFSNPKKPKSGQFAALVTGGTSDIPVAEEAAVTLEVMGKRVKRFYDCGVAGIHRLIDHLPEIEKADIIISIAGMEGALPSVLAGLLPKPIIAVPTSVGYGSSFKGIAPLLTMLNSCAQGVVVVNIDSGLSAACFASLILDQK
jgi:NCAIR mutase (PurE)-related protein